METATIVILSVLLLAVLALLAAWLFIQWMRKRREGRVVNIEEDNICKLFIPAQLVPWCPCV